MYRYVQHECLAGYVRIPCPYVALISSVRASCDWGSLRWPWLGVDKGTTLCVV